MGRHSSNVYNDSFVKSVLELRNEGLTYQEISKVLDIPFGSVCYYAKKLIGSTSKIKKRVEHESFFEKYDYFKSKYPDANKKELADKIGVSQSYVYHRLKERDKQMNKHEELKNIIAERSKNRILKSLKYYHN